MDWQLHPHSAGQTVQATYHTGYSQVPGWCVTLFKVVSLCINPILQVFAGWS